MPNVQNYEHYDGPRSPQRMTVQYLAKNTGVNKVDVKNVLYTLWYYIGERLVDGKTFEMRGVGTLILRKRKGRHKPAGQFVQKSTGKVMTIPARYQPESRFVKIKVSPKLKARLNPQCSYAKYARNK